MRSRHAYAHAHGAGAVHVLALASTINTSGRVMSQSELLSFFGRGSRSSESLPDIPAKRPKTASVDSFFSNEGELSESESGALHCDEQEDPGGSESDTSMVSGMSSMAVGVSKCNKHGMVKKSSARVPKLQ